MELQIIQNKIYEIRGQKVMLDFDLAELYGTETRLLKRAVRRNMERFPDDFMFELTNEEANCLLSSRGCVKTLTQPFFMRKAQTFSSPGFVITQSFRIFRYKVFRYGKVTFSSLHSQSNRSFSTKN